MTEEKEIILDNTERKFQAIIKRYGGDDEEGLERDLRSLLGRVETDISNQISRALSDVRFGIKNIKAYPEQTLTTKF